MIYTKISSRWPKLNLSPDTNLTVQQNCSIKHHSFIYSCLYSFLPSFIYSLPHSFIYSFLHSLFYSFLHSLFCSFLPSFTYSFLPSFIYPSFIHSFLHSFIHSFYSLIQIPDDAQYIITNVTKYSTEVDGVSYNVLIVTASIKSSDLSCVWFKRPKDNRAPFGPVMEGSLLV